MGSSSPLRCCSGLRRIGEGPPLMGTNKGGGVASEDEDVKNTMLKTTVTGVEIEDHP